MSERVWVVRQGCKGGTYLWGFGKDYESWQYAGIGSARSERPVPEWGEQGGATRYTSRVQAVRDAKRAHGRIVKLVLRKP